MATLRISQILEWADDHRRRTGKWPTLNSGLVLAAPWEKWMNIYAALYIGLRGLRGGSSIARLLALHRGYRHQRLQPKYSEKQILAWADEYHARTGRWPRVLSGTIRGAPGETWVSVNRALWRGLRGMPGGDTLAMLLSRRRGVRNPRRLPPLTIAKILSWADRHHRRFKRWPGQTSGPVYGQPGETWAAVQSSLSGGGRGFPGGESLGHLLFVHRGARNTRNAPRLSIAKILEWADAYHERMGKWPTEDSGAIKEQPGETWTAVAMALGHGSRGLPRRHDTLARVLARHRGHRNISDLPRLTFDRILTWADAHCARTGRWPTQDDGAVAGAPGERWRNLQAVMLHGGRGLPYPISLAKLLELRRGRRYRLAPPPLTLAQIIEWANAHRARTGRWPHDHSGRIPEAPIETWGAVDRSMRDGRRGIPPGWSLPKLLKGWTGRRAARTR